MNVLFVAGQKTERTVQALNKTLSSTGVNIMTEMYLDDVQNVYSRGDSFDKIIVIEQAWTHNGQYTLNSTHTDMYGNKHTMKEDLIDFIADLYSRFNGSQQCIFMTKSDEVAEIIYNEIIQMQNNAVVVMTPTPLSVQFMTELVLRDIQAIDPNVLYQPKEIAGEADEAFDTEYNNFDGGEYGGDFQGGWQDDESVPNPEFTPDMGQFDENQFGDSYDGFDSGDSQFGDGQDGQFDNNQFGDYDGFDNNQFDEYGKADNAGNVSGMKQDPFSTDNQYDNNQYDNDPFSKPQGQEQDPYDDMNNGYGLGDDSLQTEMDNQGQTVEVPDDQYTYGGFNTDPYAQGQDPYAQGQDPYAQGQDPYAQGQDPYAQGQDPYAQGQDPYQQSQDPYSQMGDPFQNDTNAGYQNQAPQQPQQPVNTNQQAANMGKPQKKGLFGKLQKKGAPAVVPVVTPTPAPQQSIGDPYADADPYQNTQNNQNNWNNNPMDMDPYGANPYDDSNNDVRQNVDPNARVLTDINLNDAAKLFAAFANRGNSIMVTGAPGAGTSTVAFQLANIIRLMNYSVLLVDFDVKGRSQTYIQQANYNATDHDESRLAAAVNSSQGINQYIAIAAQNLHLLNLGLDIDDKPIDQMIQKNRVMKFANQAKNGHNFVIYDVPFDYAAGHLEDITTMADNIVIVQDASTWGQMKTLLYMMNVGDDTVLETLFSKSQILFNRYRNFPKILGEKVRKPEDILKAMDKQLTDLVGADIGYSFRSIHVCGSIGYMDSLEEGWMGRDKSQWTATRNGQAAFIEILKNIVFRGNQR